MSVFSHDENNTPSSQPDVPVVSGGVLLKRDQQKPGILAAKNLAAELGNKSKSLELIAKGSGWKNWSTMHAALSGSGLPWPAHCPKMAALHERFGLDSQDPDVVIQKITGLVFTEGAGAKDMWQQRARTWLDGCVRGTFDYHRAHNVQVGYLALRAAVTMSGIPGFDSFVRGYLNGQMDGPGRKSVLYFSKITPLWCNRRALEGQTQDPLAVQHMGLCAMQFGSSLRLDPILSV